MSTANVFARTCLPAVITLLVVGTAVASPTIEPGECAVLVGPGAVPETFSSDARVRDRCDGTATSTTGLAGPRSIQAWMEPASFGSRNCQTVGWIANRFVVGGIAVVQSRIGIEGWYRGLLQSAQYVSSSDEFNSISVKASIVEVDGGRVLAEREVFASCPLARIFHDGRFGAEFVASLRGGHEYDVRLTMEAEISQPSTGFGSGLLWFDFGRTPGTGVGYDRIDVCITAPEDFSDIRAGLDAANAALGVLEDSVNALDAEIDGVTAALGDLDAKADETLALLRAQARKDIEWKLYQKDCVPSLWHPSVQGGQAEEARALVADLIAASAATGEEGANIRLAEQKLAEADGAWADLQYHRTCKLLSDAVRALTVP